LLKNETYGPVTQHRFQQKAGVFWPFIYTTKAFWVPENVNF